MTKLGAIIYKKSIPTLTKIEKNKFFLLLPFAKRVQPASPYKFVSVQWTALLERLERAYLPLPRNANLGFPACLSIASYLTRI